MTNTYRFADKLIRITSLYDRVHDYCKDYAAEGMPDFAVNITQADIDYERERNARTAEIECREPLNSPDDYLEELAVYRKISEQMPYHDTFLFHGSCVAVDGVGYLFTAKSGTGKSTHTRLWRELLGDSAVMVNDDKPLIKCTDNSVTVYGTPYNGKHRLGSNISVPLKAVCILERAEQNTIRRITKEEAYPMLVQQMYRPSDAGALALSMVLIDRLAAQAGLYRLGANMDISAAETAYNEMKG
ncbi:MAG: hypothetical protein IJ571_07740 [Ruminococcus sp.]|nr:hypothetical protein [Ruminococcus sp.]